MNQRGWYQVPTLNDHTAKTMLHIYQQVQMGMPQGVPAGMTQAPQGNFMGDMQQ